MIRVWWAVVGGPGFFVGGSPEDCPKMCGETQVARLVAHGRSNPDIAKDLYISTGTVKTHVSNIVTKPEVRNRVGIAAWAWEHGIAYPADYT